MATITDKFLIETKGYNDIIDITSQVQSCTLRHNIKEGLCHVYAMGSTVGITTLEYEPGLIADLKEALEIIAPMGKEYHHDQKWHDGNGFSHVRSAILGNGITIPIVSGALELGTWQQIVLIDFDNRMRSRNVLVQIIS